MLDTSSYMKLNSFYIDETIESFVKEELSKNSAEVFSVNYNEKKIWIKRARGTSSSKIHKILYKVFNFESLIDSLELPQIHLLRYFLLLLEFL